MYCKYCGSRIDEDSAFCSVCGGKTGAFQHNANNRQNTQHTNQRVGDTDSIWWGVLGFFLPIVGLVLYLAWKDVYPLRSKMAGKGALISVIIEFALILFYSVLGLILLI